MVVDVGVVKNHIKPKADITLYNMRKVDLIEYIRTLEHNYNVAVSFNENQARYIESLGITDHKWIPVTKRLPEIPDGWQENPEPVLYMMKSTKTIYAGYYGEGGIWRDKYFRQYADSRNGVDADDVLCWMWQHDLPEPPKGE